MVEKRLRDIMTRKFTSVRKNCPLSEAVKLLCDSAVNEFSSLVVVEDDNQTFWGMFSMECILERVHPSFMKKAAEAKIVAWDGLLTESSRKLANLTVQDIADREIPRLGPEDRLVKVIDLFLKKNRRELPVIIGATAVGLVGMHNVVREINTLIGF